MRALDLTRRIAYSPLIKDHHAPGRFIKYVSYSHAPAEIAIPAVYARQTRPKACTMCLLAHTCMGDRRFAGLQCAMKHNNTNTRSGHGCTVLTRGETRARGSLASRRAVHAACSAVDARHLLEISSDTCSGDGSSNDSSTRPAGTRAIVSAQHEAMFMLMSVHRAGEPAHLPECSSSSLNA